MAGLVEAFCVQSLPKTSVDFLFALTEEYQIGVADDKKNDKAYLLKVVLRHLTSADVENSADKGAAVFLKLYGELGEQLSAADVAVKVEMPPLEKDSGDENASGVSETLSYHKLRQFKINGTIGDPGQKNCLSYSSLCFQIAQGESQNYSTREIYAGIICIVLYFSCPL